MCVGWQISKQINNKDRDDFVEGQMHFQWCHHGETSALQKAWIAMSKEKPYRTDNSAYTCNHMAHFHLQLQP